jgi:GT2 family glycosyltransferase
MKMKIKEDFSTRVGVVIIGRNEGERLVRCFRSLQPDTNRLVYVDSGSSDSSQSTAQAMGVELVALDTSIPFTAARARNAGFMRLISLYPDVDYVQFVDGDCEISTGWIIAAADFLDANPKVAVVCGRRREKYPESTIYNNLCDREWDTPVGETKACGGDAMMRTKQFMEVGGYREHLIAGEEPELCLRLRFAGWKIWRIDHEMTMHDAAITRFSQWWQRSVRAGHAYAEGAWLYGNTPERHWVKESARAWLWGFIIPLIAVLLTLANPLVGWMVLLVYVLQMLKMRYTLRNQNASWAYIAFNMLGKFAEACGQIKFIWSLLTRKQVRLIEYK